MKKRVWSRGILITSASFICTIGLMTSGSLAKSRGNDYCVLSVGDLNADGIGDYGVGTRPAARAMRQRPT